MSASQSDGTSRQAGIQQISAPELKAMIDSGAAFEFVDVRTEMEREIAHIEMSLDRATPMVFQCHHGMRSQSAAQHFLANGFTTLYNLEGGIDAWSALVDPAVPRY